MTHHDSAAVAQGSAGGYGHEVAGAAQQKTDALESEFGDKLGAEDTILKRILALMGASQDAEGGNEDSLYHYVVRWC